MRNIFESIAKQREILDTLEAVKGANYAKFIRHSYSTAVLAREYEAEVPDMAIAFAMSIGNMLADLAAVYGIDLQDPAVILDVESLGIDLTVKASA
jgi:hypothetical protein